MKPGDRVRVLRGEHEGRCGVVVDPAESIASVRRMITPSATRDHLEESLAVTAGCQLVRLDRPDLRDAAYVANRTVSIAEADLSPESHLDRMVNRHAESARVFMDLAAESVLPDRITPGGTCRIPLLDHLAELEAIARAAMDPKGRRWTPYDPIPRWRGGVEIGGIVSSTGRREDAAHIVAAQPDALLALIAKLCDAVRLLQSMHTRLDPTLGATWHRDAARCMQDLLSIQVPR
jgi:hypothetical protein